MWKNLKNLDIKYITAYLRTLAFLKSSFLPSWHSWIHVSNSVVCSEIMTYEHDFLEILLDFWHAWRPFFSLKQPVLNLVFIFNEGIWSVLQICTANLIWEHQWETAPSKQSNRQQGLYHVNNKETSQEPKKTDRCEATNRNNGNYVIQYTSTEKSVKESVFWSEFCDAV